MNRPLRVAMVAYAHYFTDARIKNYVDALLDADATIDVFALGKRVDVQTQGNLNVYHLATKYQGSSTLRYIVEQMLFLLRVGWELMIHSFRGRYDVVHVHNMPDVLALAAFPLRIVGTRIILDIHDTMPEAYATKFGYSLKSLPIKILVAEELLSAACADKIIATNDMHKEVLVGHGIPERKIEQILNVGNNKIFKPRPASLNGQQLWLGYHGTIADRLGVLLIVDALSLVKNDCPGVRFLCVGEGDDLERMKVRAHEQGVDHLIEWIPFVEVERLPEVLKRVHVGIIGNKRETELKHNYMLPVKMLEYAAMEIPTIVPRLKILERYFDETSAFFYEPDSASAMAETIRSIYTKRTQITNRVAGLKLFNQQYNWGGMAKRYLHSLGELVNTNE